MGRSFVLEEVEAEEGVRARDGEGEWRPRRREGGVAGAGEWRMGCGDPGGEDGGGSAVMRVIGGDEDDECSGNGREQVIWDGVTVLIGLRLSKMGHTSQSNKPSCVIGPSIKPKTTHQGPI